MATCDSGDEDTARESGPCLAATTANAEHTPVATLLVPATAHAVAHRHLGGFALLPFVRHFVLFQFLYALCLILGYGPGAFAVP